MAASSFEDALAAAEAAVGRPVTFVKMDCEGAELDILEHVRDWNHVTRLVVEYSFTKRRSLAEFRDVAAKLGRHFDSVVCDRLPDDPSVGEWAGHTDALVFCSVSRAARS